ncbi:Glutaredoxin [Polyrhizophydium stewartii]|uniref:Glutaredoxin n=1 Tax=Polyrhizophydium stewartii TaxID=2732419 RepID=A0ABR4NAU2_9FUNG|nr:hypothetical protein HK105_008287 [Polyrhizophydium stewartii]
MSAVAALVENAIAKNGAVVFSKTYCPYCVRAKEHLAKLGIAFELYELDTRDDGPAIQQYLLERTKQRTVPNIFINQEHIGGCSDLLAKYK